MSARRWMDWQPQNLEKAAEIDPTKPTEPGFDGFVGAVSAQSSKIEGIDATRSRGFVALKGGLTLPVEVIELALDLERRGIPLATDANHQFIVPNDPQLTGADYVAIRRWRLHLGAAVEYRAPELS